ncbi:MAG: YiiD C-terminal domain-containing protein [Chitinophagales bacterium]|nr:YiiD C-terminal domain-containing protein [Chitinophagales bacterium]
MISSLRKHIWKLNFYPPYIGAGIRLHSVNDDFTCIVMKMKFKWWNKNLVGTQFGGSLYSMTDPFYMFILMEHLGKDFIVWDKAAHIKFVSPGKSEVFAKFEVDKTELANIKQTMQSNEKMDFHFKTTITDINDKIVALLEKTVYVRRK